jgi:glycosyltransferase involved in cell wall biosynthesis
LDDQVSEPSEAGAEHAADPNIFNEDYEAFRPATAGDRPTVLQILPKLVSGGVERGTVDVATALVSAGWRAIVVSGGGVMIRELERVGAEHVELPVHSKNPMYWRANYEALVDLFQRERVDIVHARSRIPAWLAWLAARRTGIPFVTTFHQRPYAGNALKRRYNAVMTKGDRVIAISHYVADELLQRYGMDRSRLRVIPRGVDLTLFDPDKVPAERMIRLVNKWRVPDGVPIVMLPARISGWKGHRLLLDALAMLPKGSFHCLMVGDEGSGRIKAQLERYVAKSGLGPYVHFVGKTDDMPAAYKLADVVVSASTDPEPFGRVMIEAQAMGRPIVAADHGGARESVIPGETGWLFPPNDAAALADRIRALLTLDEAERMRVSTKAVAHVRGNFSRWQMCARTLAVYAELFTGQDPHLGLVQDPEEDPSEINAGDRPGGPSA